MTQAGEPQLLPVDVRSLDNDVTVLDIAPLEVSVILDQLAVRSVRVVVDRGSVPPGLEIGTVDVIPTTVQAQGPESRLRLVTRALARVRIDPSGIDVSEQVDLVPVDVDGQPVTAVELSPGTATVEIEVSTAETSKTCPSPPTWSEARRPGWSSRRSALTPRRSPCSERRIRWARCPASLPRRSTWRPSPPCGGRGRDHRAGRDPFRRWDCLDGGGLGHRGSEFASRTILVGPVCQNVGAGLTCEPQTGQVPVTVRDPISGFGAVPVPDHACAEHGRPRREDPGDADRHVARGDHPRSTLGPDRGDSRRHRSLTRGPERTWADSSAPTASVVSPTST